MNCDPVDVALQHVNEARHLLETLITSSESFDYRKARAALTALTKKARELERVSAQLAAQKSHAIPSNVVMLPQSTAMPAPAHSS